MMESASYHRDYSNDIEHLEDEMDNEDSRTLGKLAERLENPESVFFLLDTIPDDGKEETEINISTSDTGTAVEKLERDQSYREIAGKIDEHQFNKSVGRLPGLTRKPISEGYRSGIGLKVLSDDELEGVARGRVGWENSRQDRLEKGGAVASFGSLGALTYQGYKIASETVKSTVLENQKINDIHDLTGFTDQDAVISCGLLGAAVYGAIALQQAESYEIGIKMRAKDEKRRRKANEWIEKYGDAEIV